MKKISFVGHDLAAMCRLCLSGRDVTTFDVFSFSPRFKNRIADVIMKCAPVQIMKCDEMPKFICQLCYTQLEKIHQFQAQVIESDKTLRSYILQQLNASDKKSKPQSSIQTPSDDPLIDNTNADITEKCESSKLHDVFDLNVNWSEKEHDNFYSAKKINSEMSLKSKIKDEPMDGSLILTESNDDFFEVDSDISCEDTKVGFSNTSVNSACIRSIDVGENFENRDKSKNISVNREKTKKAIEIKSGDIGDMCSSRIGSSKHHHVAKKQHQCDVCNKYFTRSGSLKLHKRVHTDEKPHQCDICNKFFSQSGGLNRHKAIHAEKPYLCDVCNKCFKQLDFLNKHRFLHHNMT